MGTIEPLLPAQKRRGRRRSDDRRTLTAFSGSCAPVPGGGRDLPRRFGSPSTCHCRLQEWQDQGVWEQIWLTFLSLLDQQGKLDWSQAFLDGSFVPAKKTLYVNTR
jgi:putative transposase